MNLLRFTVQDLKDAMRLIKNMDEQCAKHSFNHETGRPHSIDELALTTEIKPSVPVVGDYYQHYQGGIYRIIARPVAPFIVSNYANYIWYQNVATSQVYAESAESFYEPIDVDGTTCIDQFTRIEHKR